MACAAVWADWWVPEDSSAEMVRHTTAVAALVAGRLVGGLEGARRGSGGLGERRARRAALPELGGVEIVAVDQLLVAEPDAERHDDDAVVVGQRRSVRSQALSVTIRTPAMGTSLARAGDESATSALTTVWGGDPTDRGRACRRSWLAMISARSRRRRPTPTATEPSTRTRRPRPCEAPERLETTSTTTPITTVRQCRAAQRRPGSPTAELPEPAPQDGHPEDRGHAVGDRQRDGQARARSSSAPGPGPAPR